MNGRIIITLLLGAIANFLLGWIIYGMILMGYMESMLIEYEGLMNEESPAMMVGYFISSLAMAGILIYIIKRGLANSRQGLMAGLLLGLLMSISYNVMFYTGWNLTNSVAYYVLDTLAFTVMTGLTGLVVGWLLGRKPANAGS